MGWRVRWNKENLNGGTVRRMEGAAAKGQRDVAKNLQ